VVQLFNVYYPVRKVVLLVGEAAIIFFSFLVALYIRFGQDSYSALVYQHGTYKIVAITLYALFCLYSFDLYAPQKLESRNDLYARLLVVLGVLSLFLALVGFLYPRSMLGKDVYLIAVIILTFNLVVWRAVYGWILKQPYMRQRVYVMGSGEQAWQLVESLRRSTDLGLDVVAWSGQRLDKPLTQTALAEAARELRTTRIVDEVIVALSDRRGMLPVRELLDLRFSGIRVVDAHTLLEKTTGKMELDGLNPSMMIFADGFRLDRTMLFMRRVVSLLTSLTILLLCLPLIPFIVLAIKLNSPGPVLFRQERVGRNGIAFTLYKFRTMYHNAEANTGPIWVELGDPRITRVGKFLRISRLDEIPQLWNVLKGDMGFVGPRPERPEFVQWLADKIPYYNFRHIIRPGVTGWAQVRYQYGASLEQTKEKLKYDLYYIKHMSVALDLVILVETIKTVLWARGR
jgi:sugar transferase (PEP-CTERM system associated)